MVGRNTIDKDAKALRREYPKVLQPSGTFKEVLRSNGKAAVEAFLFPYKLTRDVVNGIRLSKGNFKELTGLLAQRIESNLLAMGVLSESKYKDRTKKIEEITGAKKVHASDFAKALGENNSNMKSILPPIKRGREI